MNPRVQAVYLLLFALVLTGVTLGCSRKTTSKPQQDDSGQLRDYKKMIERVRGRAGYEASLQEVKLAVEKFQVNLGRLPTNLVELTRYNFLPKIPAEVPEGYTFGYDSVRGRVNFIKIPNK